jgi:hypothetical protein
LRTFDRLARWGELAPSSLTLGIAADAVRVRGQKPALEMPESAANFSKSDLKGLSFGHRMRVKQIVDRHIVGNHVKPVGQFKAFLGKDPSVTKACDAKGSFMHKLERQARFDVFGGTTRPAQEQVPGAQAEMLGNEKPKADEISRDLVGQELPHVALDGSGVARFELEAFASPTGLDLLWLPRGQKVVEFFFERRIPQ